jgi:hypothetical protein
MPQQIDPVTLRELLDYDPIKGSFVWLKRDRTWFASDRLYDSWNTEFAGSPALTNLTDNGYLRGTILQQTYLAHRVAYAICFGWCREIDHINGVRTDNRIVNLRSVTKSENARNQPLKSNNSSGVVGVSRGKDCWRAEITVQGKVIRLGNFHFFTDAVEARRLAENKYSFHPNHGRR